MSPALLALLGLLCGLAGGLAVHAVVRPRRWHPRLRRLRRYLLGRAWRPVLLAPYVPTERKPAPPSDHPHPPGAPPSSS
ncbi:hypothetical protein SAMN04488120_10765 [Fontimonas thermophila]|uniref:Uncharacterized protein n=1 Tax=Fontimonas thermophila TaxID=1076937 RepID=A0A1I2JE79_9GAMM|nr:hypothetical protein [Fontimonas thermophila]SFF53162.1 hypothetical protein SAMN04488120_10765 [Fontimonas thermophila]